MPSLNIAFDDIKKVIVVDDKPEGREMIAECLEDANLEPIFQEPGHYSAADYVDNIIKKSHAAIFDNHLKPGNYASFDGIEAVAIAYKKNFPALLMSIFLQPDIKEIRPFRRHIPITIPGGEAEPELLLNGFKQCIDEFSGHFTPERKPRRTLVRIEEVYKNSLNVIVPAWDYKTAISIPTTMIPVKLRKNLSPGRRFFAYVNTGASIIDQLYFERFELAEDPKGEYAKFLRA